MYVYFSDHYEYDYEMLERQKVDPFANICSLRFFTEDTGICQEVSAAYSYLLMQAGVEATVMSGKRGSDGVGHQWSYVRINGSDFHVDPTYVLSDKGSLSYFMMTDAQREAEDGYDPADFYITSHYSREHPHPDYAADDETFSAVWPYVFDGFLPEKDILLGSRYDENGNRVDLEFDYAGY